MTAEEKLVSNCLERAIADFQSHASAGIIRRFATEAPSIFANVAASMLLTGPETAGFRYLAMLLVKQPSLFKQLSNPQMFTRMQAVTLSRRLSNADPSLDLRFARQLPARNGSTDDTLNGQFAERTLDILDEISAGNRLVPILSHLTRHPDQKISSKATLLVGKRVQNVAFAKTIIAEEPDGRIRANAIEAIWGNDSPPVQELFWQCTEDQHNRVVGNSIVGLYLAGVDKVDGVITRFAHDQKAEFRMTSAWTMGKIANADYIPTLAPLIKDQHPGVRSAALRSLQNIRQVEKVRRPSETNLEAELPVEHATPEAPAAAAAAAPAFKFELRLDGSKGR